MREVLKHRMWYPQVLPRLLWHQMKQHPTTLLISPPTALPVHCLPAHRPPCSSANTPSTLVLRDLCTCCSFAWNKHPSSTYPPESPYLSFNMSIPKAFLDTSLYQNNPTRHFLPPFPIFMQRAHITIDLSTECSFATLCFF